ncbi:MAG: PilZ domain-containing protein [Desulfobacterales bacterium]|nr:PilZ domain-containing protein [Desulfobacterales bacterium]
MKDNRKYKRNPYTREVIFTVEGIEYQGVIQNFSVAGMFIKTDEFFSLGTAVALTFPSCDKTKQLKFHAEIIRNTDDGIGVKFLRSREAL